MTTNRWFDVDKEGFSKLVAEQKAQAMIEVAFSNTLDQDVKLVEIVLEPENPKDKPGKTAIPWVFTVIDDDPNGFADLGHAYTVFAESNKKTQATKRGRFNLGEKLLLSLCREAKITSTKGTVSFRPDGTRTEGKTAREAGTEVRAVLELTAAEKKQFDKLVSMVLIPPKVTITYNGEKLEHRELSGVIDAKGLDTVIGAELRPSKRNTKVELYEVLDGEEAHIYELGIPVVATPLPYHANVMQKVPLNFNRDNVPAAFLRDVRTLVLDNRFTDLDDEHVNSVWVKDALPQATPEAVRSVIERRFGEGAVAFDPSDQEANRISASQGRTVVGGRTFNKEEWAAVRGAGVLPRAGEVTPSNAFVELSADGKSEVPQDKWTANQRAIVEYAKRVATALIGRDITVTLHNDVTMNALAFYSRSVGRLGFNIGNLGKSWFENPDEQKVDELILHELAHEFEDNHLDHRFHDALCTLGARMKRHPELRLEV